MYDFLWSLLNATGLVCQPTRFPQMPAIHKLHPSVTRWAALIRQERSFADTHEGSLRWLQGLLLWSSCMEMRTCRLAQSIGPPWKSWETRPPSQQPRSSHELGILAIQETNKTSNRGEPPKKEQKQLGAMKQRPEIPLREACVEALHSSETSCCTIAQAHDQL